MSTRRIDTHEEPWLREALDGLLADEPPMAPTAFVEDVRRGRLALAVARRRRATFGAVAAVLVAVAVPVGLVLRATPDVAAPPASSHSPVVDAAPWTPADGYAATPKELQQRVVALLPAGVTASPAPDASDCLDPMACTVVRLQLTSAAGSGTLTVGATTDGPGGTPDRCREPLIPGETCTVLLPWTRVGAATVSGVRSESSAGRCGDSWLVVRGSTVVDVSLVPPAAGPGCPTPLGAEAAAPVLTQDQLRALALAVPLPARLAAYVDAVPHSPTPGPSGATQTSPTPTPGDQASPTPQTAAQIAAAKAHPCSASDLVVTQPWHDGATGTMLYGLVLHNRSGSACGLVGFPSVRLVGAGGALPLVTHERPGGSGTPLPVAPSAVLLQPGADAHSLVTKYRCDSGTVAESRELQVSVVGAAPVTLPLREWLCTGGTADPGNQLDVYGYYPGASG